MLNLSNVIEACNIINDANAKLHSVLRMPVELQLIEPQIPGLYDTEVLINRVKSDLYKNAIIEVVCECYTISLARFRSKNKAQDLVDARKIATVLLIKYTGDISDDEMGELLNVDRTSIAYYRKNVNGLIQTNKKFNTKYSAVLKRLIKRLEQND